MLPTLNGRIQTRVFVLLVVGGLWTLIITPLLGQPYATTFVVLLAVIVLGVGWELVLPPHPAVPLGEGLADAVRAAHRRQRGGPAVAADLGARRAGAAAGGAPGVFLVQFLTTWIIVWLVVNGPMRVPFVHRRFRGGRLI